MKICFTVSSNCIYVLQITLFAWFSCCVVKPRQFYPLTNVTLNREHTSTGAKQSYKSGSTALTNPNQNVMASSLTHAPSLQQVWSKLVQYFLSCWQINQQRWNSVDGSVLQDRWWYRGLCLQQNCSEIRGHSSTEWVFMLADISQVFNNIRHMISLRFITTHHHLCLMFPEWHYGDCSIWWVHSDFNFIEN